MFGIYLAGTLVTMFGFIRFIVKEKPHVCKGSCGQKINSEESWNGH